MRFKVSVLRGTKVRPELVEVTTVMADYFTISGVYDSGVYFYNREMSWTGRIKHSHLITFLPGTEWIVERA